jgi:hypothetical protein
VLSGFIKESCNWLEIHEPQTYVAFEVDLKPEAYFSTISSLVEKVIAVILG